MKLLTTLIHNDNCDYSKQYTLVSKHLGYKLDICLKEIERFYYNNFWISRLKRRLEEEGLEYHPIQLDIILGTISYLRDDTKFQLFDEDENQNGRSDNGTMIALNINMKDMNDSYIKNIIMHEFGHRQYNQPQFDIIRRLNSIVLKDPKLYLNQTLGENDLQYFTDLNELRQRIIPIIKEMYDNDWSSEEAYELSENLKNDDIKDIFKKDYIIDLLENIL